MATASEGFFAACWDGFVRSEFLEAKLWSTLGMLVLTVACAYVPWLIRARSRNSATILSFLNCLAGGVVLGALLMHMVPEMVGHHHHHHHAGGSPSTPPASGMEKAVASPAAGGAGPPALGGGTFYLPSGADYAPSRRPAPVSSGGGGHAEGCGCGGHGSAYTSRALPAPTTKGLYERKVSLGDGFASYPLESSPAVRVASKKSGRNSSKGASNDKEDPKGMDGAELPPRTMTMPYVCGKKGCTIVHAPRKVSAGITKPAAPSFSLDNMACGDCAPLPYGGQKGGSAIFDEEPPLSPTASSSLEGERSSKRRRPKGSKRADSSAAARREQDLVASRAQSASAIRRAEREEEREILEVLLCYKLASEQSARATAAAKGGALLGGADGTACSKGCCSHAPVPATLGGSAGAGRAPYNWGPLFAGLSFLVLLAIDRLFMHEHSHSHHHGSEASTHHSAGHSTMEHRHGVEEECTERVHFADEEDDDCASCHSENVMGGCHMDGLDSHSSKSQAIIFVVALSMHSFLEGLAMATKSTQYALSMYLISLFAHKWLEAFALGVNVMNASFSAGYSMVLIAFYSLLTPFGILLGMMLRSYNLKSVFVSQCLNGLAAGSFLFVSCIEMIPPEFHKKTSQTVWKFAVLCAGFAIMAAIARIPHEC